MRNANASLNSTFRTALIAFALWAFGANQNPSALGGDQTNVTGGALGQTGKPTNTVLGIEGPPFVEKHDLDWSSYRGYATLTVEKPSVPLGSLLSVDIRFFNSSGGDYFYNPFYRRLIPLPAQLAIYDSTKRYLGDRLAFAGGSRVSVGSKDWTYVPSLCYVGTTMRVPVHDLSPGVYYLQIIYFKSFAALNPAASGGGTEESRLAGFLAHFDHSELFRSNPVKIEVIK
jgi:hypothetical protein